MARKIRKLYRTKGKIVELHVGIVVRNRKTGKTQQRYIDFSGGVMHPTFKPSTFWTSDPVVQEGLERSKFFDDKFELVKAFEVDDDPEDEEEPVVEKQEVVVEETTPKKTTAKKKSSAKSVKVEKQPKEAPVKKEPIRVPQVKTVQGAIGNLIKQGAEPDNLDTVDDVLREAKNLNVEYPNLKTE